MARKCRANLDEIKTAEVASEVGVRSQGPDLATAAKKRKLNREESALSSPSSTYSRRIGIQESADRSSSGSDQDVSCCSSNGSGERSELPDLEAEDYETGISTHFRCCASKESTMCDCDLDSTPESLAKLRRVSAEKMPTDAELEEFFAEAEKNLQKQFIEKYNYDIVKDEPLEGRYEWIRLNP